MIFKQKPVALAFMSLVLALLSAGCGMTYDSRKGRYTYDPECVAQRGRTDDPRCSSEEQPHLKDRSTPNQGWFPDPQDEKRKSGAPPDP
ncbi:MAG: hypothetical protein AB7N80_00285 [Bdellovibrionales bacterium]